MAITIQQNPFLHSPAYNELDFVVTSGNIAETNFRFVCDVYITGVTPAYFRMFADKDPQFSSGHFDVHRVVENYMSGNITLADYGFQVNQNSFKKYTCKFGEAYGPSSGVVVYADLATDSARYAWNGISDFIDFKNLTANTYLKQDFLSGTPKFLTAQPNPNSIADSETAWLYMISISTDNTIDRMNIVTYDINGNAIQTVRVNNPFKSSSTNDNHKFLRVGCGTKNLNLIESSKITLGAQPIITSSVVKYTLQIINDSGASVGELFTFKIKEVCTKDVATRLHFLNKLGGFDSFTFDKSKKQSADIQRSKYKRMQGGFTSANAWAYGKADSLDLNFDVSIKDTIILVSDWINETQSIWLEELVTSPWVLLDDATDGLISVNIKDTRYNRRKHSTDKIFNLEINIEYTYNRNRQRL